MTRMSLNVCHWSAIVNFQIIPNTCISVFLAMRYCVVYPFMIDVIGKELLGTFEPHREKTGLLPMRKQRRRSASQ